MNVAHVSEHTPGPWFHGKDSDDILHRSPDGIVAVASPADGYDEEQWRVDAALIAAAPELLACLRRMCGMYGAYSRRLAPLLAEDNGTVWTFERANSLALEAIAKAEGRS